MDSTTKAVKRERFRRGLLAVISTIAGQSLGDPGRKSVNGFESGL
jgi:hypothetical protein